MARLFRAQAGTGANGGMIHLGGLKSVEDCAAASAVPRVTSAKREQGLSARRSDYVHFTDSPGAEHHQVLLGQFRSGAEQKPAGPVMDIAGNGHSGLKLVDGEFTHEHPLFLVWS